MTSIKPRVKHIYLKLIQIAFQKVSSFYVISVFQHNQHRPRGINNLIILPNTNAQVLPNDINCLSPKHVSIICQWNNGILITSLFSGCRKWQVANDCDADNFKALIYTIYPRLASVPGYTLWNLKKDNSFEKLPPKVLYLQTHGYIYFIKDKTKLFWMD